MNNYYFDIYKSIDEFYSDRFCFDNTGVIMVSGSNSHYNPSTISQFILSCINFNIDESKYKPSIEWLLNNYKNENNVCGWFYLNDFPRYRLKAPWFSGMAHGLVYSALIRSYLVFPEYKQEIERILEEAFKTFEKSVDNGGVNTNLSEYNLLEEFGSSDPIIILNGHLYGLFGLYDYVKFRNHDDEVYNTFKEIFKDTEKVITLFDTGCWSYYDLLKRNHTRVFSSKFYHILHIKQLKALLEIGKESELSCQNIEVTLDNFKKYLEDYESNRKTIKFQSKLNQGIRFFFRSIGLEKWRNVLK